MKRGLVLGAGTMTLPGLLRHAGEGIDPPMNVLFIISDDLRPQLGCYGHSWMLSPNIDALAKEGLLFERAYCQQALCAPSRVSFLTGARPDTTHVYSIPTFLHDTRPDLLTMPQYFKAHGYRTISLGKVFHNREKDDPTGWEVGPWRLNANGSWQDYATLEAQEMLESEERGPAYEKADVDDDGYADGLTTARALQEMEADPSRPFFLSVGFTKPHLPFNAPRKYWDLYAPEVISRAENPFRPAGAPDVALTNWSELRAYHGIPEEGELSEEIARTLIHGYYACVSYVDALVGQLIEGLRTRGLWERTIVILLGDHGYQLGEHGLWTKHSNFEIAVRAPLIVRTPASIGKRSPNSEEASLSTIMQSTGQSGQRTSSLVEFVDVFPALCDLCGLPQPAHLEGKSFVPLLEDPAQSWKEAAFSQYPRFVDREGGTVLWAMGYSVRTDRYRFTWWRDMEVNVDLAFELYDHVSDAGENNNVAYIPEHTTLIDTLKQILFEDFPSLRGSIQTENSGSVLNVEQAQTSVFPNPFFVQAQFKLILPQEDRVRVEAFDVRGRRVSFLFEGNLEANRPYWFIFERGQLASGSYLLRATGARTSVTESVILIR